MSSRKRSRSRSRSPTNKRRERRSRSRSPEKEGGRFVWKLRDEKLRAEGKDPREVNEQMRARNQEELKKARQRREEREFQKKRFMQEKDRLTRGSELAAIEESIKQEEQFFYQQAKKRAEIRVKEKRPKLIDIFYSVIAYQSLIDKLETVRIDLDDKPNVVLSQSPVEEIEQLQKDMELFLKFDKENNIYWRTLSEICEFEIQSKNKSMGSTGIHKTVQADIDELLKGKSRAELEELEKGIKETLDSGAAVDSEYYESVLDQLKVEKFRSELDRRYQAAQAIFRIGQGNSIVASNGEDERTIMEEDDDNSLHALKSEMSGASKKMEELKSQMSKFMTEDEMYRQEASVLMDEDEDELTSDFPLPKKEYPWENEHKPIKPKFYNRINAAFDWNSYNRVHYDADNPPPKTINGYKFNIFYPNLVDKSSTPSWKMEKIPGDPDHLCIRFSGGAPYEDIGFRIINKEWEHSRRFGFKSTFERGVLRLWFQYKKYKYRR